MAEVEGDVEKAEDLGLELEELELRAKELDTRRTSTISAIRSAERTLFAVSISTTFATQQTSNWSFSSNSLILIVW